MVPTGATDRRAAGRGRLLAMLAVLGVLAGAAAEAKAQDGYGRGGEGYGPERTAYFQSGRRARDGAYAGYGGPGYGGASPGYGGGYRRGQVLPQDQRDRYVDDPGRYHLRAAPNGYGWVGDGRNAYLTQRSTGMVLDAVPGAYEPPSRGGGGRGYQGGGGRGYEGGGGGRALQSGRGDEGRGGRTQDGGGGKRGRR